jgi:phosphatidylserine/phosphatidylglycerophosphate/cardiolipin synthase-like enzyme
VRREQQIQAGLIVLLLQRPRSIGSIQSGVQPIAFGVADRSVRLAPVGRRNRQVTAHLIQATRAPAVLLRRRRQTVRHGDGGEVISGALTNLRLFNSLIHSAQRRLSITSPYFVPDDSLLYAITTAAQRGVAVELFVSEQGDQFMVHHAQCSYYKALLKAGVRIYLYPAPFILHSKHFSVDDDVAVIGSSNMDIRSFNLDFEISVMCLSRSLTTAMREVEDLYRSLSRELTLDEWYRRPLGKRYIDNVMRLTSALP